MGNFTPLALRDYSQRHNWYHWFSDLSSRKEFFVIFVCFVGYQLNKKPRLTAGALEYFRIFVQALRHGNVLVKIDILN